MIGMPAARDVRQWWREVGPGFNKKILNPVMLQLAGRRFWYAARLEHVGRRSGRLYATPVVARRLSGGFAIPLPYGTDVDWLRNLEAAGSGELVVSGSRYTVGGPCVVSFEDVAPEFGWAAREAYRLMGVVGPWLRLTDRSTTTRSPATAPAPPAPTTPAAPD